MIVSFQNCSPYHQNGTGALSSDGGSGGSSGGPDTSGNPLNGDLVSGAAFTSTVYPILQANCTGCHDQTQVPLFLDTTDGQITHDLLIINSLINAGAPTTSRIVSKIQNGHQNIPLTVGDDILRAIIDWSNQIP